MEIKWDAFANAVKSDILPVAQGQFTEMMNQAKNEGSQFAKFYADQVKEYVAQLSNGTISKEQYEGLLEDLSLLIDMQLMKTGLEAKVRVEKILNALLDIAVNKLGSLI